MNQAALFWSGGKDSSFALYEVLTNQPDVQVRYLITTINSEYRRVSMHGVREELLEKQAEAIGIPLMKMYVPNSPDNTIYEECLHVVLGKLKDDGITHIIFGDIFLQDLKEYRLSLLKQHGLEGIFPLWQRSTEVLIDDFINLKFKTLTCCINSAHLTEDWLGRVIDKLFVSSLPNFVDPCGENGEFHTFCFDGPIFQQPIHLRLGEKKYSPLLIETVDGVHRSGFWYIDLLL